MAFWTKVVLVEKDLGMGLRALHCKIDEDSFQVLSIGTIYQDYLGNITVAALWRMD